MKQGFTILEMILVIIVMGIIFLFSQNLFLSTNQNALNSQSCINFLYGEVSLFLEGGITGKGVFSGSQRIFPDTYRILFDTEEDSVNFGYKNLSGEFISTKIFTLSGGNTTNSSCMGKGYRTLFTGGSLEVWINKNILSTSDISTFQISGTNNFTGAIMTLLCEGNGCREFYQFVIDKRISQISGKKCVGYQTGGICKERSN